MSNQVSGRATKNPKNSMVICPGRGALKIGDYRGQSERANVISVEASSFSSNMHKHKSSVPTIPGARINCCRSPLLRKALAPCPLFAGHRSVTSPQEREAQHILRVVGGALLALPGCDKIGAPNYVRKSLMNLASISTGCVHGRKKF